MKVDLKRLFLGKTALFFALAVPVVLALLISLMVAPYFYADVRTQGFSVAVLNEDDHVLTRTLLQGLAESKSLSGLIQTEYVDSREQGLEAVEKGAAAFIHIPIGLQRTLETGGRMDISYYGNQRMPLEDKLLLNRSVPEYLWSAMRSTLSTRFSLPHVRRAPGLKKLQVVITAWRVFFLSMC